MKLTKTHSDFYWGRKEDQGDVKASQKERHGSVKKGRDRQVF